MFFLIFLTNFIVKNNAIINNDNHEHNTKTVTVMISSFLSKLLLTPFNESTVSIKTIATIVTTIPKKYKSTYSIFYPLLFNYIYNMLLKLVNINFKYAFII